MNIKKIIREEINKVIENKSGESNYAKTLQDEELTEGVTYLPSQETGLSCDIIVDCGKTYEIYGHPLCLYIVNGNKVIPIDITKSISVSANCTLEITMFIRDNYKALCAFADMEIDGPDFFNIIKNYKYKVKSKLIAEMSNYGPDKTGLPIWVYIDDTNSYLRSGHNGSYRMKFQQDKNVSNPRSWMPIAIPSMEIMDTGKLPPIKIPQKHVNLVLSWVKGNMQLLENLRDGVINGIQFKDQMKTMKEIAVMTTSENGD